MHKHRIDSIQVVAIEEAYLDLTFTTLRLKDFYLSTKGPSKLAFGRSGIRIPESDAARRLAGCSLQ
jgi:hypothetical protein